MNEPMEAQSAPNISLALTSVLEALRVQNGHTLTEPENSTTLNCVGSLLHELPSHLRRQFVRDAISLGGGSAELVQGVIEKDLGLRRWAADMERRALEEAIFAQPRLDAVRDVLNVDRKGLSG